jgi:chemotaxis protein methyltransferase CheR
MPFEMLTQAQQHAVEDVEFRLLLDGLFYCYGLDYRDYEPEPLKQRLWSCARAEATETISAFQDRVLHNPEVLDRVVAQLVSPAPALFHEPQFYAAFRTEVVPRLRTYPSVKIWQPGCATGEDAFTLAILLQEEGLLNRSKIYATEVAASVFRQASLGRVPFERVASSQENYRAAGGTRTLDGYFTQVGDEAILAAELRAAVSFSAHSLATDDVFNEFEVIVCRHGLHAYNRWLQERVQGLFNKSLSRFGMLCLGEGEALRGMPAEGWYDECRNGAGIFRKKS